MGGNMKREEKNLISCRKIMDSARKEFSEKGYGLSSVNTICSEGDISKGILYHYFKDKDEIYLKCIQECFDGLTEYLKVYEKEMRGNVTEQLNQYFSARFAYFSLHAEQQGIFCEAVISPPEHLKNRIAEIRKGFDCLNVRILEGFLSRLTLRPGISKEDVIDIFRQYQDFMNARYQMTGNPPQGLQEREQTCKKAVLVLLYGVAEAKEENGDGQ